MSRIEIFGTFACESRSAFILTFSFNYTTMAKLYNNDKNFLVIEMTGAEASSLGFGIEIPGCLNAIICGGCNSQIEHKDIYYIAGINEVMCKDCCDDYVKHMNHYKDYDSVRYEVNHFNVIASKLGMSEKASIIEGNEIEISSN